MINSSIKEISKSNDFIQIDIISKITSNRRLHITMSPKDYQNWYNENLKDHTYKDNPNYDFYIEVHDLQNKKYIF